MSFPFFEVFREFFSFSRFFLTPHPLASARLTVFGVQLSRDACFAKNSLLRHWRSKELPRNCWRFPFTPPNLRF